MGGSSKSSSSSSQSTTTRDERIAATDNAVVLKESLNNLSSIQMIDGGAFDLGGQAIGSSERIALKVLEGAQTAINKTFDSASGGLDKILEYVNSKEEDSNSSNLQKTLPWLVAGVSIFALTRAMKG